MHTLGFVINIGDSDVKDVRREVRMLPKVIGERSAKSKLKEGGNMHPSIDWF